jgi:hypothetical protein
MNLRLPLLAAPLPVTAVRDAWDWLIVGCTVVTLVAGVPAVSSASARATSTRAPIQASAKSALSSRMTMPSTATTLASNSSAAASTCS